MKIGYDVVQSFSRAMIESRGDDCCQIVTVEKVVLECLRSMSEYGIEVNPTMMEQIESIVSAVPYIKDGGLYDYSGDASDYEGIQENPLLFSIINVVFNSYDMEPTPITSKLIEVFNKIDMDTQDSLICFDIIKAVLKCEDMTIAQLLKHYDVMSNINSFKLLQIRNGIINYSTAVYVGVSGEGLVEDESDIDNTSEETDDDGVEGNASDERRIMAAIKNELKKMEQVDIVAHIDGTKFESDPVIGREKEINLIAEKMLKKRRSNVVMLGDAGVGKTEIVNGFAYRVANGLIGGNFDTNCDIYSLNISGLMAGTRYRGELEARLNYVFKLFTDYAAYRKIILYIDEIHLIVGTGASGESSADVANLLKPVLATGNVKIIGSTTFQEYNQISKDKALSRRFETITIEEPDVNDTIEVLRGIVPSYENDFGITVPDGAIEEMVSLADNYIKDKYFPDKAIEVLDSTMAYCKFNGKTEVGSDDIIHTVSNISRIDISRASTSGIKVTELKNVIEQSLFGQSEAVDRMVQLIKTYKAGFNDEGKTIGNILMFGKTGTGKTELCKLIAENMGLKLIRFDMSEYAEEYTISKLIGSPAGYVGYGDGGLLTEAVSQTPHCVLLLDEIEKAHPKIYNLLLQIMDYGSLTDSRGKKVDFTNVILVMTSNVGVGKTKAVAPIGFTALSGGNSTDKANVSQLTSAFPSEFVGRLDEIVRFNDITKEIAAKVADKEIAKVQAKALKQGYNVSVTNEARESIIDSANIEELGARNIGKEVQRVIQPLVVDYTFSENPDRNITIDVVSGEVAIA